MNNDIALITDEHFGSKNHSISVFEIQMDFYQKQFFPYLLENNIKKVFSLGDCVHNRSVISLYILQELKKRFFGWFEKNKIELHCIIGNHDLYFKNSLLVNFYAENVNEYEYVKYYDKDTIINIGQYTIGLVPWIIEPKTWKAPKQCDVLFAHLEVAGIQMQKGLFSQHGHDSNVFKEFKLVCSGHYHNRSVNGTLHYLGSQYPLSWNDFDTEKGFYVLRDNYQLDFIPNNITPKFLKLYYNDESGKQILQVAGLEKDKIKKISIKQAVELSKNNYLKVYIEKCKDQLAFDNFYESICLNSKNDQKIEIINMDDVLEDFDSKSFEEFLELDTSTLELIENYISNMTFEESIEKELLLDLSRNLYADAYNEAHLGED